MSLGKRGLFLSLGISPTQSWAYGSCAGGGRICRACCCTQSAVLCFGELCKGQQSLFHQVSAFVQEAKAAKMPGQVRESQAGTIWLLGDSYLKSHPKVWKYPMNSGIVKVSLPKPHCYQCCSSVTAGVQCLLLSSIGSLTFVYSMLEWKENCLKRWVFLAYIYFLLTQLPWCLLLEANGMF